MFQNVDLTSSDRCGLSTEIRFAIASATVDQLELLAISYHKTLDQSIDKRMISAIARILSAIKRDGKLSFYITYDSLSGASTEAEFLKNKYSEQLNMDTSDKFVFLVKL